MIRIVFHNFFILFFRKSKKEISQDKKQMKLLRKNNAIDKDYEKPQKFKYVFQGQKKDFENLKEGYPYNWYLGGKLYIHY